MEEMNGKEDLQGYGQWQMFARSSGSLKNTASGRSTPRDSPRKLRASQREFRGSYWRLHRFAVNRLVFWLVLIGVWAYLGFLVQSKWAHSEGSVAEFDVHKSEFHDDKGATVHHAGSYSRYGHRDAAMQEVFKHFGSGKVGAVLFERSSSRASDGNATLQPDGKLALGRRSVHDTPVKLGNAVVSDGADVDSELVKPNASYGLLVGPFGKIEDKVLGWTAEKRKGTCERSSSFAKLVQSKKFVLVLHELSMTGAPISMMELATEILNCGGAVSVVALSMKGGLLPELNRRRIKVLWDKGKYSFRDAIRANLVIAGSAVCSSWIEEYLSRFPSRSNRIVWWIMENRREYFDKSKKVLGRVKVLMFLADSQSRQWLTWCQEEGMHLRTVPTTVPLSVNDELAFVAGIPCPLNDPSFSPEKMQEKRNVLRLAVRREMGLTNNDVLVISLSSINPGKGQYYVLQSLLMLDQSHDESDSSIVKQQASEKVGHVMRIADDDLTRTDNIDIARTRKRKRSPVNGNFIKTIRKKGSHRTRNLLSENEDYRTSLKLLIGSVGSKSNKVPYIKEMLGFLSQHPNLSRSLLWTPATAHVSSLYAAADVYIINAQGIGETFGRVTIEAMAFGLPVLGTDAGGTREIVEHGTNGLLHPVSRDGVEVLAQNLHFLLKNSSARVQLGKNGRSKVQKLYMKQHMYDKLAVVFAKCMGLPSL